MTSNRPGPGDGPSDHITAAILAQAEPFSTGGAAVAAMTERWVLWKDALAIIRACVNVSEGKSQTMLKGACASGEVRVSVDGNIVSFASIPEFAWTHGGMGAEGRHWIEGVGRLLKFSGADLR